MSAVNIAIDQFQLLTSGLSNTRRERLGHAFQALADGLATGAIANPVFQSAKETINRAIYDGWSREIADKYFSCRKWESLPASVVEAYWTINMDGVHSIVATSKKIDRLAADHSLEAIDAMLGFVRELGPLLQAFAQLKEMVVKRRIKSDEERAAEKRFEPPPSSTEATARVRALLEEIVAAQYARLLDALRSGYSDQLARFLNKVDKASSQYEPVSYPVSYCVERVGNFNSRRFAKKPNADSIIADLAKRDAEGIRDAFIYKNLKKLCSIVEAKGNLRTVEVVAHSVNLMGLEGVIAFSFADGARFVAKNSTVLSRSVHDKPFMRHPLTFHDVFLAPDEKMERPSEERMHTLFAPHSAAAVRCDETPIGVSVGVRHGHRR